jgi:hypothetical protein
MIFEQLRPLELRISKYLDVNMANLIVSEGYISSYASMVADYNHEINIALKEYHTFEGIGIKIEAKALLKFSYDYIHLLLQLLKILQASFIIDLQLHKEIHETCHNKDELLKTTYIPLAEKEMELFYSPEVRKNLNDFLNRKIGERYN